jgi:hypothetical protein
MTYPVWALGPHDNQAYQLDASKWIVLRFFRLIFDVPGNDLFVYRSSGSGSATVKVSNDWRGPWQTLGTANSAITEFDIGTAGFESVQYVRLEASGQFMLDAVEAPQPGTGTAEYGSGSQINNAGFTVTPTLLKRGGKLMLTNLNAHSIELKFFNLIGQEVARQRLLPGSNAIVVKDLPAGIYFLRSDASKAVRGIILID